MLQQAADGVLFLDEIAELPLEMQPVLLRVLEDFAFHPLGSIAPLEFRAQVISATNREAATLVERGAMRADLYFRLAHVIVPVPPIAERAGDLELLVRHLWRRADDSEPPEELIADATGRAWPGNVRQLRHAIERAALLRRTVGLGSLSDALGAPIAPATEDAARSGTLAELRERFERGVLVSVLRRCGGDLDAVARELSITRRSVYNLLKRHRIPPGK
jgi:DNA-binding NtrC family response regulator